MCVYASIVRETKTLTMLALTPNAQRVRTQQTPQGPQRQRRQPGMKAYHGPEPSGKPLGTFKRCPAVSPTRLIKNRKKEEGRRLCQRKVRFPDKKGRASARERAM